MSIAISCLLSSLVAFVPSPPELVKKSWTYKKVGSLAIQLDSYRPADKKVRPVVVWIHGGALIMGSRTGVPRRLKDFCRSNGYALLSLDYRLAPEVKLPAIIEDVEAAFAWIRKEGPSRLHIDPSRMVVAGGSAGGYLTLMTGIRIKPRPTALVAYWGYGDVDGPWYTTPSAFYRKRVPLIKKEEAYKAIGEKAISGTDGKTRGNRGRFYLYLRQNGLWTKVVTGFDHRTERAKLTPYCPVRAAKADFPPTLLVHGTKDTDVPYPLSVNMAKKLKALKVSHRLVTVPDAGHGLAGGDRKRIEAAHQQALKFIRSHLEKE